MSIRAALVIVLPVIALPVAGCAPASDEPLTVRFVEVTESAGLSSEASWKYGGPTLADLNGDGRYDLVLGNHHEVPAQLFYSTGDDGFVESEPLMRGDVHGIAAGDYDLDGWIDLLVSVGGGNGADPRPPRLLHNRGGHFEDVTEAAGISEMGARGRSVRWIDLDTDGDLDLLQINARQLPAETGPRNILFENLGHGRFVYRKSPGFENLEAERVLVTDIDNDHVPDLVTFEPLTILRGTDNFRFTDVSDVWLRNIGAMRRGFAMAASEADIDNDGDMDIYVARGKTYYQIANNALEFDADTGRMDLRDEGNEGQDAVSFTAGESVSLSDFYHWPRGVDLTLPVYLGESQHRIETPISPVTVSAERAQGFAPKLEQNGWYLGHLGDGRWRLAWNLNGDLAWDIRASVSGVTRVSPDWEPQHLGVPDLLLINEGDHFRDASELLPSASQNNNWGVITGDFDNDTFADFFIYRFGRLHGRIEDVLLLNRNGTPGFVANLDHGANNLAAGGHGDMGAPLDYDADGWLDILSGSDDAGRWHLYRNSTAEDRRAINRSLTVHVGHSPRGTDPHGAEISLSTASGTQFKRVGSAGAVHSQSLNHLVHFGLGGENRAEFVRVRWRDGTEFTAESLASGTTHFVGTRIRSDRPTRN